VADTVSVRVCVSSPTCATTRKVTTSPGRRLPRDLINIAPTPDVVHRISWCAPISIFGKGETMVPPRHMSASYSSIDVRDAGDDTDKITTGELVRFRICSDTTEASPFGVAVTVTPEICSGLEDVEDDSSR